MLMMFQHNTECIVLTEADVTTQPMIIEIAICTMSRRLDIHIGYNSLPLFRIWMTPLSPIFADTLNG